MRRSILALVFATLLAPSAAVAQDMNIALSRLRIRAEDPMVNPTTSCPTAFSSGGMALGRDFCLDQQAWRQVMSQFAGSLIPPLLTSAGTRGVRGIYVGFETWLTGIDSDQEYWHRAVEGDGGSMDSTRSRFVDNMLAWGRFNVRKGLPFGFELGTSVGYMANSSYWTLGLEIRWAVFEGFREDVGWIPDLAVRGAVQTLIGDGEFNVTIPTVDIILSEPFVVANSIEITPSIYTQFAWVFADSELVDLTPETGAFEGCNPDPAMPDAMSGRPPYCRGDGRELNHNVVFPQVRSTRIRLGAGLQLRYEWFTILSSFVFDAAAPADLDSDLLERCSPSTPAGTCDAENFVVDGAGERIPLVPRQWQVDIGVGLTF